MYINPALVKDAYKFSHKFQYPPNLTEVFSNFTSRGSRIPFIDRVVVFGIQYYLIEYLIERWNRDFFDQKKDFVINHYKKRADHMLGKDAIDPEHIANLHELGYLPLRIKALREGVLCPLRVPMMTFRNTHEDFAWVTNMGETNLSLAVWHPQTSATKSFYLYKQLLADAIRTNSGMKDFVRYQGHDFSMRGQTSLESAMASGAGHLLSFFGTDTVPALDWLEEYYDFEYDMWPGVGTSVPALEHSVMQAAGPEREFETIKRILTEVHPTGPVSIISDTWNLWRVLTEFVPQLKSEILARQPDKNGRAACTIWRPDSGVPEDILCGNPNSKYEPEYKGVVELLWDTFQGTESPEAYKQLDSHVSSIYGDSMNHDRMQTINERLAAKGFASTNYVGGLGSYFFQYVTRDTFSSAVKNTNVVLDGIPQVTFKDPITDDGTKRSARGYLRVNADLTLSEEVTEEEENEGELQVVFENSKLVKRWSYGDVHSQLMSQL